jgi:hypothetical protein
MKRPNSYTGWFVYKIVKYVHHTQIIETDKIKTEIENGEEYTAYSFDFY